MNCSDSFIDIHNHCPNEILPGIVTVQSYNVDELFEIPKETFYTIGIHPWHADIADGIELLASKITEFNPIAIGECGFDKLRGPDAATQERTFVQQVFLSEKLQLPIILHSVKSLDRILAIRIKAECRMPWVLHGFRGNFTTAQMLAKHGIAVSFGRAVITTPQLAEVVVHRITSYNVCYTKLLRAY